MNRGEDAIAPTGRIVEVVTRGAEQCPALGDYALEVAREERFASEFGRESGPSIGDTNDFMAVADCHLTYGANSRVQPGRVTSRG